MPKEKFKSKPTVAGKYVPKKGEIQPPVHRKPKKKKEERLQYQPPTLTAAQKKQRAARKARQERADLPAATRKVLDTADAAKSKVKAVADFLKKFGIK
jgi:hypothetical protein